MEPDASSAPRARLRLIGVTDLHANLYPYDYFRDRPDPSVGLAQTAALIAEARRQSPNCLLFDNGDILQGTPLGDLAAERSLSGEAEVHPVIAAMNVLNYAAATLGNHEFNYGIEVLERAYAGARFPVVCCNIHRPDGSPWFPPSVVVEAKIVDNLGASRPVKVGVIGFAPPQIAQWDEAHVAGKLVFSGIIESAAGEVAALERQGVDIIVALCHSGISREAPSPGEENAALDLAAVQGIDALFIGHQHLLFPGEDFRDVPGLDAARGVIRGKPAVMAGFWGSHLGVIDLTLEFRADRWRVIDATDEARPIAKRDDEGVAHALVASDDAVLVAAEAAHRRTLDYVRAPVGTLTEPLHTYLAMIADDPTVQLINEAQRAYAVTLAAQLADLADLPMLSAAAPFKCGGRNGPDYYTDVAPGPIAIKDVADIYPYPNSLRVLKVDGATVREWLERSASIFLRIDPASAAEQPLLGPAFACYNFDVIDGVGYQIDVTQPPRYDETGRIVDPAAHRIRDLTYAGTPIDAEQTFLIATNSYRASGGGGFPGCDGGHAEIEAPDAVRDVLLRYVTAAKTIAPRSDGNWRLAPFPASVVATYLTSAKAADLPTAASLKLTLIGPAGGGFSKFRVASP
jgi:2',3'-cyclic-nucleotide 2'-phosphodiesterase / 3'-nucleotidase